VAVFALTGCERNDLGRYCVVGQPVRNIENPDLTSGQPSVTVLNIQAPECTDRLCLQQGPVRYHPAQLEDPLRPCDASWCEQPYECGGTPSRCVYKVKSVCTRECKTHSDCKSGTQDANAAESTRYVCHRQTAGEDLEGHCICKCKDFLINPNSEPSRFYYPDEQVEEPAGCR
jgi:hypothetical protein